MTNFYTYLWLREDGTPYYVGKGSENRAFVVHHSFGGKKYSPPKDRSRILVLDRSSETDAFNTEIELIRNWGRKNNETGILRNMSDGGQGSSGCASFLGRRHSPEAIAKMRKPKPTGHGDKVSAVMMGNKRGAGNTNTLGRKIHTEEHKEKLRVTMTGNKYSVGKNLGATL